MSLSRRSVMQSAVLGSVAALAGVAGSAQAKIKKPLPAQKVSEKRRVLIQPSSRYHTSGYLDFAGEQYEQLYGSSKHEILFIPYAKVAGTYDGYEKQVQDAFKPFGHKIVSIHRFKDPQKAVREASAIAVGVAYVALVTRMYEAGIIDQIRDRVNGGIPYCGCPPAATSPARRCARRTTCRSPNRRPSTPSGSSRSRRTRTSSPLRARPASTTNARRPS